MTTANLLPGVRRVVVGSTNPVKVGAVAAIVARCAGSVVVHGVAVPSGVPDQPWGDAETLTGARQRARAALAADPAADLALGIEGGVVREPDGSVRTCAWAVATDRDGVESTGGSLVLPLPPGVVALLEQGMELGHAMDAVARTTGTKHAGGAVGVLTAGLVPLRLTYETLTAYALSRWIRHGLWDAPESTT